MVNFISQGLDIPGKIFAYKLCFDSEDILLTNVNFNDVSSSGVVRMN